MNIPDLEMYRGKSNLIYGGTIPYLSFGGSPSFPTFCLLYELISQRALFRGFAPFGAIVFTICATVVFRVIPLHKQRGG